MGLKAFSWVLLVFRSGLCFKIWSVADFHLDFSLSPRFGFCFNGGLAWLGLSVNLYIYIYILGQWDNGSCLKLNWVFNLKLKIGPKC